MVGRANAQDPQGWKRPWGLWAVELRLKEQKGPRHAPHPWSQRTGDPTWSPAGFLGSSGWGKRPSLFSCSSARASSRLLLLISPASLLCPQGPTWPGGGFGGQGTSLGDQQAPCAQVGGAITLRSSPAPPGWLLPPASPDLPGLPPMPPGPCGLDGALEGGVLAWELSRLPSPGGPGNRPPLLSRSSRRVPPACLS